ncbi:uncharacterized protein LY89DRAFT_135796 [Mollisia scopiformis]|uniref:Uncharacterized protein n=1 Tax=Mollisia scopiformis TaxID=149040 RepID=A0A194X291_MOLSC|nr:uncharacterized protein LY89DRAFT_135796 [Mollisia scopiformis]KUJ14316.1 hypothetical protein LY89DRAFT_135796 [Mollisia scopiformis]
MLVRFSRSMLSSVRFPSFPVSLTVLQYRQRPSILVLVMDPQSMKFKMTKNALSFGLSASTTRSHFLDVLSIPSCSCMRMHERWAAFHSPKAKRKVTEPLTSTRFSLSSVQRPPKAKLLPLPTLAARISTLSDVPSLKKQKESLNPQKIIVGLVSAFLVRTSCKCYVSYRIVCEMQPTCRLACRLHHAWFLWPQEWPQDHVSRLGCCKCKGDPKFVPIFAFDATGIFRRFSLSLLFPFDTATHFDLHLLLFVLTRILVTTFTTFHGSTSLASSVHWILAQIEQQQ